MLKRYIFWFTAAALFQVLTGFVHTLSLFVTPPPTNEIEREMLVLITSYKINLGAGFSPTFISLYTAFSSGFAFLCFFAAMINGYLLFKHIGPEVMRGIIAINLIIFGTMFIVMIFFTFLTPIVGTGLIFINLLASFIVIPRVEHE